MPRTLRNSQPVAEPTPIEEVDQIDPSGGNGEDSSNTFNGASQALPRNNRDDNINLGSGEDALIDAQIAAAQAAEQTLRAEVEALQRKRDLVDTINRRILQLEQHKGVLRDTLRFTTSRSSSVRESTPSSTIIPSREIPGMELEPTPIPDAMGFESDLDTIRPEPQYNVLKTYLDREKLLKVRAPDVYRGKSLKEWRTFMSSWEAVFRTQPWTYNRHSARVNSAASALRDDPHDAWEAAMKQNPPACEIHWERFKAYLADMLQAPQTRQQDAFEELRDLQQKDGETVAELYTRMVSLEVDQDTRPEKDRVRTLDAALSDHKTRSMLVSILSGGEAASVSEWLEKAQKAEHTAHPKSRRAKTGGSSKGHMASKDSDLVDTRSQGRRKKKEKYRKNRGNDTGGNSGPFRPHPGPSSASIGTCWTCNQKGHFSGSPKCPKYDEWARQNPDKAKTIEESRRLQRQVNAIIDEERSRGATSKELGKGKAKS